MKRAPRATGPPPKKAETVPGQTEGEDVEMTGDLGPPATTSAARRTTVAGEGEDDGVTFPMPAPVPEVVMAADAGLEQGGGEGAGDVKMEE